VGLPQSEITIAELLKPLGYATAAYGKWHLGEADKFSPRKQGFDEYIGRKHSNLNNPNWKKKRRRAPARQKQSGTR
jgi:arylsulfatase A-like enzyme